MKLRLVQALNFIWLVSVLAALPWMASRSLGNLQVASRSAWQTLTFTACGLGVGLNLLGWWLAKRRPLSRSCLGWSLVFVVLGVFEILLFRGILHFRWMQ